MTISRSSALPINVMHDVNGALFLSAFFLCISVFTAALTFILTFATYMHHSSQEI